VVSLQQAQPLRHLFGDRMKPEQRRTVGWTLLAIGILSTIPLAADVFGKLRAPADAGHGEYGATRLASAQEMTHTPTTPRQVNL
jgi:hypothetical protein